MLNTISFIWSKILKKSRCSAIRNSSVDKTSKIEAGSSFINSSMAKYSFCGYDCDIFNCEIGSFCSIANNVIIGGAMHPIKWVSTSPVFYEGKDSVKKKFSEFKRDPDKRTIIGNDVWIGNNALIKQGVKIGNGAVIGMGSIVTKDVEPYAIVGGNPAHQIRLRFDPQTINELEELKWWKLDETILSSAAQKIKDPIDFIKYLKTL